MLRARALLKSSINTVGRPSLVQAVSASARIMNSAQPAAAYPSPHGCGLVLHLYIQPNASRDELVGLHGGELKVSVSAPPVDGASNARLTKLLSTEFGVPKSAIILERGHTSRHKRILIQGVQLNPPASSLPAMVQELLAALPPPALPETKPSLGKRKNKGKGK